MIADLKGFGDVLSTHVEVVRARGRKPSAGARALHARGGGPTCQPIAAQYSACSPRTWR